MEENVMEKEHPFREWTIGELIEKYKAGNLVINPEYQRGSVWKVHQMLMLIDSIFRGYNMPMLYLRRMGGGKYEVIDGQQRINAICAFESGWYHEVEFNEKESGIIKIAKKFPRLYNPAEKGTKMKLPESLQKEKCDWANKTFEELSEESRKDFLDLPIIILPIDHDDDGSRDLFIRLQGGTALEPQEVRDAWPGNFCDLILQTGGKPELNDFSETKYNGHEFFREQMNMKSVSDRGKTRKLVAQMLMLFLERKEKGISSFLSINNEHINIFYGKKVGMNIKSDIVKRFISILDELQLYSHKKGFSQDPFRSYEPLHLILFADMLLGDFDSAWQKEIGFAYGKFIEIIGDVKKFPTSDNLKDNNFIEIWNYFQQTKSQVNSAETIKSRHMIYARQMLRLLGDSVKTNIRTQGFMEAIYYRNNAICQKCESFVEWEDADIIRYENYDMECACPNLRNHALVHKSCPNKE